MKIRVSINKSTAALLFLIISLSLCALSTFLFLWQYIEFRYSIILCFMGGKYYFCCICFFAISDKT